MTSNSLFESEYKGVKCWRYDFYVKGKRYRGWLLPVSEMSKRQALAELKNIKANILVKRSTLASNRKLSTIKKVFEDYLKYLEEHKPDTWKNIRFFFKRYTFFYALLEITEDDKLAYKKKRKAEGVKGSTINRELEVARAAFNRAKRSKKWDGDNPFDRFDPYPEPVKTRYLKQTELTRLVEECIKTEKRGRSPMLLKIVMTAILTGIRLEKVLTLHKDQIYIEVESGKKDDRPVLESAINHSQLIGARLVIHKLDRLSRDLGFITALQKNSVDFAIVDLPGADKFTIHIFGALAEKERSLISERTRAALQKAKERGVKLGNAKGEGITPEIQRQGTLAASRSRIEKADSFAGKVKPFIERLRGEGKGLRQIAAVLNAEGILTARGKQWTPTAVKNAMNR